MAQSPSALAEAERQRRSEGVEEAQMLLKKGDESYLKGNFADALEAYAGARDLLPVAPLTNDLRKAATERYAQAAVEHGRHLSRKGDVAGAKVVVDRVLQQEVAPTHAGALAFRAELDDPIRTNPALTSEHARNVDQVRKLLYKDQGAFDLGLFDLAKEHYQSVLQIDPTNVAAQRGLERISRAKSDYARSAYDHTRAEILSEVDGAWETSLSPLDTNVPDLPYNRGLPGLAAIGGDIDDHLDNIIIKSVQLEQATLREAIDYLRVVSRVPGEPNRSINFTLNLGPEDADLAKSILGSQFDLQLSQVPLRQVLKFITEMTRTVFTTDGYSVIIRPTGTDSDVLVDRTYRVPPDFLTSLAAGSLAEKEEVDPFADNSSQPGLLTERISVQEALKTQGIRFPEGAYARFFGGTSVLSVRNTAHYQGIIEQIVDQIIQTEPVLVSVKVTLIRTQKTILEELGFDWLLNPSALSDDVFLGGGTPGNSPGRRVRDFNSTIPGLPDDTTAPAPNVVTNGLRSGEFAVTGNTLDQIIANPNRDIQESSIAPGVLSLTGLFTDGEAQLIMRGLSQNKSVDVMSQPSVITRSGQQATVEVIDNFFYPSEYEPPQIPQGVAGGGLAPVTPATPTAFENRDVGMVLQVLPVAGPEKRYIELTLKPSFSELDGFVDYGSPITSVVPTTLGGSQSVELTENNILMPVFSVQQTNTQLSLADGATLVYGGLMSNSIQQTEDKVPVLGDLPFVGRMFSSTANQPVSSAIVFMVKVELLDPTGRPFRDR